MTALLKIQRKGQMTLPSRFRSAIGVAEGGVVEASVRNGKMVLTPKPPIGLSAFPNADDEYTSAQRRVIEARLTKSEEDLKRGRTFGPFDTAEEMIAHMKKQLRGRAASTKTKRAR